MGIVRSTIYTIDCDTCGARYDWKDFENKRSALRIIRDEGWGWKRETGQVFCPEHNDFDNG